MCLINCCNRFGIQQRISKRHQRIHRIIRWTLYSFIHNKIFRQKILKIMIKSYPDFSFISHQFFHILRSHNLFKKYSANPVKCFLHLFFSMFVIMIEYFIDIYTNSPDNLTGYIHSIYVIFFCLFYYQSST